MRVTPSMSARTLVASLGRSAARLARLQEEIATGRRLLAPSDDPGGAVRALDGRARIARFAQLSRNAERALASLGAIDGSLAEAAGILVQAKEVALQSANAPVTSEDRKAAAAQVDEMIRRLTQIGNTNDGERYLFGGRETLEAPFAVAEGSIRYRGDDGETSARVDASQEVPFLLPGSRAFRVAPATLGGEEDLDPDLWEFTPLSDLNGGRGVVLSTIEITDSSGASGNVDLVGAATVKDVLDRINASGLSVSATVNAEGNGIAITDLAGGTTLTIAEVGDGIAAQDLGILGSFAGGVAGEDLDPAVTEATPLALLRSGSGVALGTIRVAHEIEGVVRSGEVDLSFARTVGDLAVGLARAANPDGESLRIEGAVSDSGTGFVVRSTLPGTRLTVQDAPGATGAEELGVAGSAAPRDLFAVLEGLADALRADDQEGIEEAVGLLDEGLSRNLEARAEIGARVERLEGVRASLEARRLAAEKDLSSLEDADLAEVVVEASREQVAYQAALAASSRTISLSLLDFLR